MDSDFSFKHYKKRGDIHGTILYPAVMVAPVQRKILSDIILHNEINSVFDPFHGSGTALYEAMRIDPTLHLVGCDINPLANLITRAKLQGVDSDIERDIHLLSELIASDTYDDFTFPNITKWFRNDIIESIAVIRSSIMQIANDKNRIFFWCMLCDTIRRFSNTRSSTYKLHIKTQESVKCIDNKAKDYFLSSVQNNAVKFTHSSDNYILLKGDTLQALTSFPEQFFDVTITSPPYGDNFTTVPYGQFSMLSLFTINNADLELEGWELDNYSKIDSNSLGGKPKPFEFEDNDFSLIKPYLDQIGKSKQRKVLLFFYDYFDFLRKTCKATSKFIIMTLGNRTVDRIRIDLTNITKSFLETHGFNNIGIYERDIPHKRTPKLTSIVGTSPVSSMNSEFTIVHRRQ